MKGKLKCDICGKDILEIIGICPECLKKTGICPRNIEQLEYINNIISITSGNMDIKKCIDNIAGLPACLERGVTDAKES